MNYEDKYNEILEWARKNKARLNGVPIEEVLPELRESEDERMRKELISMINECTNWAHKKEYIAYLEKQKENPKSADSIPPDCTSDVKCEDRWYKVTDSLPDNGRLVLAKDCLGNVLLARYDGENWEVNVYDNEDHYCHNSISKWCEIPSEKQKEQKPVQTEDEKEYVRILKSLVSDFIRDHYKNVDITFYQKIYDWLDGRHIEQKPILSDRDSTDFEIEVHEIIAQAMSDKRLADPDILEQFEQEAARALMLKIKNGQKQEHIDDKAFDNWIEDYWKHSKINNPYSYDKGDEVQFDHKGFVSFCKAYCYPQKLVLHDTFGYEEGKQIGRNEGVKLVLNEPEKYGLQKPAEWSEEDKNGMFSDIIMAIRAFYKCEREDLVDYVKSLRPSWKPSEEQEPEYYQHFDPDC